MSFESAKQAKAGEAGAPGEDAAARAADHMRKAAHDSVLSDRNVVRKDAYSAKYCPDTKDGDVCYMTQLDGEKLAEDEHKVMASTRYLARHLNPQGILEVDYVKNALHGNAPKGYYLVDGMDKQGNIDSFYFKNKKPNFLDGILHHRRLIDRLAFWTSTIVVGKPTHAHVYYGDQGGGGLNFLVHGKIAGTADDHKRELAKHAIILIDPKDLDK